MGFESISSPKYWQAKNLIISQSIYRNCVENSCASRKKSARANKRELFMVFWMVIFFGCSAKLNDWYYLKLALFFTHSLNHFGYLENDKIAFQYRCSVFVLYIMITSWIHDLTHIHLKRERQKTESSHALTGNAGIIWTKEWKQSTETNHYIYLILKCNTHIISNICAARFQ